MWRKCAAADIGQNVGERYYLDVGRWICSCPAFLHNRFLLCKHLVQSVDEGPRQLLYNDFKRDNTYPFWRVRNVEQSIVSESSQTTAPGTTYALDNDNEDVILSAEAFEKKIEYYESFIKHMREEYSSGNHKHVQILFNGTKRVRTIMEDIEKEQKKKTKQTTWKGSKPHTMFL